MSEMKILTGTQIREADRYTMQQESIESIDLMERASETIAQWIAQHVEPDVPLCFLIGKGNNGGDGLAVARILSRAGYLCEVYRLFEVEQLSPDCRTNLERLPATVSVRPFSPSVCFAEGVIVDALLGSGVHGRVEGVLAEAIDWINRQGVRVLSIDLPSGLQTEYGTDPHGVVQASTTLTLEFPKLSMLLPEAGDCAGEVVVLPIGLDAEFIRQAESPYWYVDEAWVSQRVQSRRKFAHKGTYGHALLICGSEGMIGAAILAAGAALRSGCGLVTVHMPRQETGSLYAHCPSAMLSGDDQPYFSALPAHMERFTAIGIGCGLGKRPQTLKALETLLKLERPLVLDADALNLLAENPSLQTLITPQSVLTPHVGELRRLVGPWGDDEERNQLASALAQRLASYVVVKGAHTMVCTPEGKFYFNSTGNPGMAKGGSGDVLTGLITGLIARGYDPGRAAILGVYWHGAAGDKAAEYYGQESMNSGDLAEFIQVENACM